mgnify:CR=1 FL=1
MQISARATQNVAFAEQRSQIAGQWAKAQLLTAQQQMGDTWMSRQLSHGLTVSGQFALSIHRAQPLQ